MDKIFLKEKTEHGNMLLPLNVYSFDCDKNNNIFTCHWHDELEFIIVTKGSATIQVDTTYFEVYEGQVVFVASGYIHAGHIFDGQDYSFSAIVFNHHFIRSCINDSVQLKYIDRLFATFSALHIKGEQPWENQVISKLYEILSLFCNKEFAYEIGIKANLYCSIFEILKNNQNSFSAQKFLSTEKTQNLKIVLDYIRLNYQKKITNQQLSSDVGLNESYFCHFFKQMMHTTPVEYINHFRINMASELLKNTDAKVLDIALECGFENFSYFINIFKKYMYCTPSEYRKKKL